MAKLTGAAKDAFLARMGKKPASAGKKGTKIVGGKMTKKK